ncbi:MAG: polysaccharide biosynthesis/export family protein [Gammaproteobacteria bacterium]
MRLLLALFAMALANLASAESPPAWQTSDVFGSWLFTGKFAEESLSIFNPDYQITVGDKITLKLWGAYESETNLTVDAQGNVFVPSVGPVHVQSVRNDHLNTVITDEVKRVYKNNVRVYANLEAAQPVKVFVTGFVARPGLYRGLASDSVLYYLDKAGGIDFERGSFLDVRVLRHQAPRAHIDLYRFLLNGDMPAIQFVDGDTILVGPRRHTVKVEGLAQNPHRFEFQRSIVSLEKLLAVAQPKPEATHARVVRTQGEVKNVEYYPLSEVSRVAVNDGNVVALTADKRPGTITVRVEGEQDGDREYVLRYGANLGDLLRHIRFNRRSDETAIQLFRQSVIVRQKDMLESSLKALEASVLTARSATNDEAQLRAQEAELILKWIERAKQVEPKGQVILARSKERDNILLENGDILYVPARDKLVMVHGEVFFPNALVYDPDARVEDYVRQCGGYTQNANTSRIIVRHRDGSFQQARENGWRSDFTLRIQPGDEILVLPQVAVKHLQIAKDITQILYQLAIATTVVLSI